MGSFLEGLKAGFLGSAGVDYYSKKSSETLAEIRDQNAYRDIDAGVRARLDPADWFDMAMPLMADIDQCLAWTRWVVLYKSDEIEPALARLITATSGWTAFTRVAAFPLEMMMTMSSYSALVSSWQGMCEDWLSARDTEALADKFEWLNQRWTSLDDEIRQGRV